MLVDHGAQHVLRLLAVAFAPEAAAAPGNLLPNQDAKLITELEDAARLLVVAEPDEIHAHVLHQADFLFHQVVGHRRAEARVILMPVCAAEEQTVPV